MSGWRLDNFSGENRASPLYRILVLGVPWHELHASELSVSRHTHRSENGKSKTWTSRWMVERRRRGGEGSTFRSSNRESFVARAWTLGIRYASYILVYDILDVWRRVSRCAIFFGWRMTDAFARASRFLSILLLSSPAQRRVFACVLLNVGAGQGGSWDHVFNAVANTFIRIRRVISSARHAKSRARAWWAARVSIRTLPDFSELFRSECASVIATIKSREREAKRTWIPLVEVSWISSDRPRQTSGNEAIAGARARAFNAARQHDKSTRLTRIAATTRKRQTRESWRNIRLCVKIDTLETDASPSSSRIATPC